MSRRIDAGDNAHAFFICIGYDGIHLALRELIGIEVIICFITGMYSRRNLLTRIRRSVDRKRHIVEQEAHTVVADRKLDIVKSGSGGLVDKRLDAANAEILSATVQEHDVVFIVLDCSIARCRKARQGQQAEHHDQCKNHGKHFVQRRSILCLIHLLVIPFLFSVE